MSKKLDVKHDTGEREVAVNKVWCDMGHEVDFREVRSVGDMTICEGCYEHFTDRWPSDR